MELVTRKVKLITNFILLITNIDALVTNSENQSLILESVTNSIFNNHLVTSVWVGFDQPKSLGNREFGSSTALPIWIDFMKPNLKDIPKDKNFLPEGMVSIKIDKTTGLRPINSAENSQFEYFLEEFSPE